MLISPVQNKGMWEKLRGWFQRRPRITQKFGKTPFAQAHKAWYKNGIHNGLDFGGSHGDAIFAPFHGVAKVKDSNGEGYGLHVRIRNPYTKLECVLAHLSSVAVKTGDYVVLGQQVGGMGTSGLSTGVHLHFGVRSLKENTKKDVFSWEVENYDNGCYGYWDIEPYAITWKGTLTNELI
jgi:murein DD-endopeptidase MepM/ murein hydrolase activator NlpD